MIATRVVLAVAVLTTGLFTGLLVYIVGMSQAMLSALDGTRFTAVMGRFLPAARKNVLNYLFTITGLTAPVVTLVLLRTHLDSACSGSPQPPWSSPKRWRTPRSQDFQSR